MRQNVMNILRATSELVEKLKRVNINMKDSHRYTTYNALTSTQSTQSNCVRNSAEQVRNYVEACRPSTAPAAFSS